MNAKTQNYIRKLQKPPLVIDAAHSERLEDLAYRAMQQAPAVARQLLEEVQRAEVRPAGELPHNVVTIGSRVTFRDDAGVAQTVRLVFPINADIAEGRVSILTPIGVALIGLAEGQTITWETPEGKVRHLTAVDVVQVPGDADADSANFPS
jgi:regulator of nucleoside diphosphate kinase